MTFWSCTRVEPVRESDTVFFPLELNAFTVFEVTELKHDAFLEQTDTFQFFIKETIEDTAFNNGGQVSYRVKVEKSEDDTTYTFEKYVILERDPSSAQRVEDDIRNIKLSFPLRERKTWDANELNIYDYQSARTLLIREPSTVGTTTFAETVTVDFGFDVDLFFTNIEEEVYAKDIGLVKRIFKEIETQPGKYKDGIEYEQTFYRTNR